MKRFEHGDPVETTIGNGKFIEYASGGYKIEFVDGPNVGSTLTVGERGVLTKGEKPVLAGKEVYRNSYLLLSHTPKSSTKNGDSYDVVIDEGTEQGRILLERLSAEGYNIKPLYNTENNKLISSRKLWLELREDKTLESVIHEN